MWVRHCRHITGTRHFSCSANVAARVSEAYVSVAHQLADVSGAISSSLHRTRVGVDVKPDFSPVTIADRAAEEAMRRIIHDAFDDHEVFGEESGLSSGATYQHRSLQPNSTQASTRMWKWVLDPIDGTKSFVTGAPLYGNLISLVHKDDGPVLGLINMPALGERWIGGHGLPTTQNGKRIHTRSVPALSRAVLYAPNPHYKSSQSQRAFERVRDASAFTVYGGDCYPYALLASGHVDVVLESNLKPWDYFALVPVIEGAGGIVTDWMGNKLTEDSDGYVLACGSRDVHSEVLKVLND